MGQAIGMATGHMLKLRKKLRERKMPSESKPFESKNGEMSMGNTKRVAFQSGQDHTPERVSGTLFEGQEAAASFQEAFLAWRWQSSSPSIGSNFTPATKSSRVVLVFHGDDRTKCRTLCHSRAPRLDRCRCTRAAWACIWR